MATQNKKKGWSQTESVTNLRKPIQKPDRRERAKRARKGGDRRGPVTSNVRKSDEKGDEEKKKRVMAGKVCIARSPMGNLYPKAIQKKGEEKTRPTGKGKVKREKNTATYLLMAGPPGEKRTKEERGQEGKEEPESFVRGVVKSHRRR